MDNFIGKRKPTTGKLKCPPDFDNGVVGLGIVAAMTDSNKVPEAFVPSSSSKSIPIVSSAKPAANFRFGFNLEKERGELDELLINGGSTNLVRSGIFSTSPMSCFGVSERGFFGADFLSSCFLCFKLLHGLDIFMYRGEKAFCSVECRAKHIRGDNCREKCGFEAMKEYSASPCSMAGPHALASGVVAA